MRHNIKSEWPQFPVLLQNLMLCYANDGIDNKDL